jgi:FkbM family methyltransferase
MLLNLKELVKDQNLKLRGVLHIGAHFGEENEIYDEMSIPNRFFFEPLPQNYEVLMTRIQGWPSLQVALGNQKQEVTMFVDRVNNAMSSSVLKPMKHLEQYPHIEFNDRCVVQMVRLDDVPFDRSLYNFINIDIQGYELEALKGARQTLQSVDYILTEVNNAELYEDCARIEVLSRFLRKYGFDLVIVNWFGQTWGDAFYVKRSLTERLLARLKKVCGRVGAVKRRLMNLRQG